MPFRTALVLALALVLAVPLARPVAPVRAEGARPPGLARAAGAIWAEYRDFAGTYAELLPLTIHEDASRFRAAAAEVVPDAAPWAVGFYARGEIHVLAPADPAEGRRLLRHELAHALLGPPARVPAWFNEGFAEYMESRTLPAGGPDAIAGRYRQTGLRLSSARHHVPAGLERVRDGCELAVEYLVATRGEASLSEVVRLIRSGTSFYTAFWRVYGLTEDDLQRELWEGRRSGARVGAPTARSR